MASEGDAERLVVLLEARIRDFEKNLDKASGTADRNYGRMRRSSKSATAQMEADMQRSTSRINQLLAGTSTKIGSFGRAFAGGLGAGMIAALAPIALMQKALQAINDASHKVDIADKIGISTKALQELGFGFSQAGVEAASFETSMAQFSKRIGEAATQGGKLADILKANNVAIRDGNGKIKSSEDLLRSYANLVKNAASEQEKMYLVTEAFGRSGGDMLVGLSDGAAGIDKMGASAQKAGVVIEDELLRRAEEFGDRWGEAWKFFEASSNSAILNTLRLMDSLDDRMHKFLLNRQAAELGSLAGSLVPEKGSVITGRGKGDKPNDIDVRIAGAFGGEITKADEKLVEALKKRYGAAADKATVIPGEKEKKATGSKAIAKTANDRLAESIQLVRDRIEAMKVEQATMGLSFELQEKRQVALQLEQSALRALQDAARQKGDADWKNVQLSPDQVKAIDEVSAAYARQANELREAIEAQQDLNDRAQFFGDLATGVFDDLTSGADGFKNALKRIVNALADAVIQAILLGQGPLASLFGSKPSEGNSVGGIVGQIFGLNKASETTGSVSKAVSSGVTTAFKSAGATKTGIPLSEVSVQGISAKVSEEYASRFQGLFNDLDKAGYKISSLGEGGYSYRNVAGTNTLSKHASGEAIDINPRQNPYAVGAKGNWGDYGIDPSAMAKKHGLTYGGDWNKADTMHFQVDKSATGAAKALDKMATSSTDAAKGAGKAAGGLENFAGDLSSFGKNLQSFMASAQGGGSSWFQNLAGMFGGSGGALNFMNSISPMATADILSGSWGAFADGGRVFGPGTGTSDSIPTMLSDGEFVVKASATAKHLPLLEAINSGNIQHRADGGLMGRAMPAPMSGGGGSPNVTINQTVEDHAGGLEVTNEKTTRENGDIDIRTIVRKMVAEDMMSAGNPISNALKRGYGVQKTLRRT